VVLFSMFSLPSIFALPPFLCFVSVSPLLFSPKTLFCSSLFPTNNSPVPFIFFLHLFIPSVFFVVLCFRLSKLSLFISSLYTLVLFFFPSCFLLCLLVFIGRGREDHRALSCHGVGQGGVGRLLPLQSMVFFFFQGGDRIKRHELH